MRALFMAFVIALACHSAAIGGAVEDCDQDRDHDLSIRGCSLIIDGFAKGDKKIAYLERGNAYLGKSEYERAIADYDRAIELDPKYAMAYHNRGLSHYNRRDYDQAIADYSHAIQLNPKYAVAYHGRGLAYRKKGEYDRAIADYDRVIELDPQYTEAYIVRGAAHDFKGEYDRAIADYNRAIELNPKSADAYNNRGASRHDKGEYERSIADYDRALELNPNHREASSGRRMAQEKLAEAQKAAPRNVVQQPQVSASPSAAVAPGRRVALVIGNSAYPDVGKLPNPAADARMVAASLRRLGFAEVIERYDLDLSGMIRAMKEFGDKTADADWAVVYYAGHGIEVGGVSYLVPTDAKLLRDAHVGDEALPLDRVLAKVENAKRLRLVILDACRNNPFAARMVRTSAARGVGRGLSRLEPEGGVLVAYSAKHGTLAQDGDGANSPFATALAAHLEEPGLELQFLFRKVRDRVMAQTGGAQEPFLYGSLGAEPLYFAAK
jgi:tetratricopeptide (TPR) repeat protein